MLPGKLRSTNDNDRVGDQRLDKMSNVDDRIHGQFEQDRILLLLTEHCSRKQKFAIYESGIKNTLLVFTTGNKTVTARTYQSQIQSFRSSESARMKHNSMQLHEYTAVISATSIAT